MNDLVVLALACGRFRFFAFGVSPCLSTEMIPVFAAGVCDAGSSLECPHVLADQLDWYAVGPRGAAAHTAMFRAWEFHFACLSFCASRGFPGAAESAAAAGSYDSCRAFPSGDGGAATFAILGALFFLVSEWYGRRLNEHWGSIHLFG